MDVNDARTRSRKCKRTPTDCQICSAPALYSYVGVVVCSSCKMFFKRNAGVKKKVMRCSRNGQCPITRETRHRCSPCRLAKCFACGMQVELFHSHLTKNKEKNKRKFFPPKTIAAPSDPWHFTVDQWNLLTNVLHCFDEYTPLYFLDQIRREQNKLPLKMRFKVPVVQDLLGELFFSVQRLFEWNSAYHSLSSIDRSCLFRKVIKQISGFSCYYLLHNSKLIEHPAFYQTMESIYGSSVLDNAHLMIVHLDQDMIFVKLVFALLLFSTFDANADDQMAPIILHDTSAILRIQNRYSELTWQYLLSKYDHSGAVRCFSNLIQSFFALHRSLLSLLSITEYLHLLDALIKRTEEALALQR